ncbi:beta-2 adrenergic receptor-like [Dendronephthya gigantea]|uniref:beta-2 adrenergic receptor-like n=1 Tax=Dendronephthya gigantea TaxID=151771 RepID=UPI001069600D|nr:beta-2 adrenergic receptor-like [Dendronephthya gigantea]
MESNNSSTEYTTFERDLSLTIGILLLVTSLVSIITNTLLLTAICYDPYKCFRNVPIVFVANLAVADLLTGLAVDPLLAVYNFGIYQNKHYLKIPLVSHYIALITVNNDIVTIVILIIDRSVAIKKPFLYRRVMTLKSVTIIVAISWIYSGFFCAIRLMGMSDKAYLLLDTHLHVTFSFLTLTLLFAFIYSNLKTEKRRKLKEVTSMKIQVLLFLEQNIRACSVPEQRSQPIYLCVETQELSQGSRMGREVPWTKKVKCLRK